MSMSGLTEIESLHCFLGEVIRNGGRDLTVEESIAEFRAYQEELRRFNEQLKESQEEARRGEAAPLDVDALKAEIRRELAEEGITD